MEGETTGYCKWPGSTETLAYIEAWKKINANTRCHTLDRNNMHA